MYVRTEEDGRWLLTVNQAPRSSRTDPRPVTLEE